MIANGDTRVPKKTEASNPFLPLYSISYSQFGVAILFHLRLLASSAGGLAEFDMVNARDVHRRSLELLDALYALEKLQSTSLNVGKIVLTVLNRHTLLFS